MILLAGVLHNVFRRGSEEKEIARECLRRALSLGCSLFLKDSVEVFDSSMGWLVSCFY